MATIGVLLNLLSLLVKIKQLTLTAHPNNVSDLRPSGTLVSFPIPAKHDPHPILEEVEHFLLGMVQ